MKYIFPLFVLLCIVPASVLSAGKGSLESRVEYLERMMSSEKQLELLYRVNQLQQENQQLRGLLEEQNYQLQGLKDRQRKLYRDMNLRYNQIEARQIETGNVNVQRFSSAASKTTAPVSAAGTPPSSITPKPVPAVQAPGVEIVDKSIQVNRREAGTYTQIQPEVVDASADKTQQKKSVYVAKHMSANERQREQQSYQKAYDELRAQHYAAARDSFTTFINQYPHGRYAHIAQYWIAESSYAQKDYQQAIQDYQHLIDFYPKSPKLAESQLKKAYCYYELGNKNDARKTLQLLLAQYPDTTEASQAKRLLKNL